MEIVKCRVCGNEALAPIIDLGNQRLSGVFPNPHAPQPSLSPLQVVRCDTSQSSGACGLVQLKHTAELEEMYGSTYGYHSSLSPTMESHLKEKVSSLLDFVDPAPGEIILDIGCNDGTLLNHCTGRGLRRIGIDPSSEKFADLFQPDIEVVQDFFSEDNVRTLIGEQSCKIITSIAMFYDIDDPVGFMRQIASLLSSDGVWALELSYLPLMLTNLTYDQICHEHVTYLSVRDIQRMAKMAGMRIVDIETNDVNGGSFYLTVCRGDAPYQTKQSTVDHFVEKERKLSDPETYMRFRDRVYSHRDEVIDLLKFLRSNGKKVYGYGASTKGNIVQNFCGIDKSLLPFISDINPEKHGLITPGSTIPIISHERMREDQPDYLFVFIWHFRKEVITNERGFLERGGKLIFPLPRIHEVDSENYEEFLDSDFKELAYEL